MAATAETKNLYALPVPEGPLAPVIELAQRRRDKAQSIGRVSLELQARYDAITELAEATDGNMQIPIELQYDPKTDDLYGPDGRSVNQVTLKAIEDAEKKAAKNPNFAFEVPRREQEREEFLEQLAMARGNGHNTIVTTSDNPLVEMGATDSIGGYNHVRLQAMLRASFLQPDGKILMISQSLDKSNRRGLEAIHTNLGFQTESREMLGQRRHLHLTPGEQERLVDQGRDIYDAELADQFGGEWFAGRTPADYRNTYDFVCAQEDLIQVYVRARREGTLDNKLMYNLIATMQARFEKGKETDEQPNQPALQRPVSILNDTVQIGYYANNTEMLNKEMRLAGNSARAAGKKFSACGSTYDGESSTEGSLENVGIGKEAGESKSWHGGKRYKNEKCVSCEKVKKEVGACKICEDCVKNPKKHKLGTVQGRTGDPKKAKINKEPAKILSFEDGRKAREKRLAHANRPLTNA